MLRDTKTMCLNACKPLGNLDNYTIDFLADSYCDALDADDPALKNIYVSALLVKFWPYINFMYEKCLSIGGFDRDEFFGILYDRINYACKYRSWQNPAKNCSARTAIVNCIKTEIKNRYYFSNLKKNQTQRMSVSLETPVAGKAFSEDKELTLQDVLASDDYEQMEANTFANSFVQNLLNNNKIVEAIISDKIAFADVFKSSKKTIKYTDAAGKEQKYKKTESKLSKMLLTDELKSISSDYIDYFSKKYRVSKAKLQDIAQKVASSPKQKLGNYVRTTLTLLKTYIN